MSGMRPWKLHVEKSLYQLGNRVKDERSLRASLEQNHEWFPIGSTDPCQWAILICYASWFHFSRLQEHITVDCRLWIFDWTNIYKKTTFRGLTELATNIRPRPWRVVRLILLFGLSSSPQVSSTLPGARPPAKPWRQGPSRGGRWRHRCRKLVPSSWHILELGNQNHPLLRAELGSLPLDTYKHCQLLYPSDMHFSIVSGLPTKR